MPFFLSERVTNVHEQMENPDCDPVKLRNTYRQFRIINALVSGSRAVYCRWIRPAMTRRGASYTLLDIGFGGGDVALRYALWAQQDGYRLEVTGIDMDQRAYDYVASLDWPENVSFHCMDAAELVATDRRFDFVVSNHVLHHLDATSLVTLLDYAKRLARRRALFADICRSDVAYALFYLLTLTGFHDSYIRPDGLLSIRRSYTRRELLAAAPPGWRVATQLPFRLVLAHTPNEESP
jgi:2-polyprenyl-3-methyl-5-hydroxy-6-metoxy-1,4-benzoquinol methylase